MIEALQSSLWLAQALTTWLHAANSWIKAHYEFASILVAMLNAIATLAAVGVALFLQYLRERWMRPVLRLTFRQRDFTIEKDPATDNEVHWYRLHVVNDGDQAAEAVEATVVDVYKRVRLGHYRIVREFLPTPLRWTHSKTALRVFLPGKASRLLDFGSFSYVPTSDGIIYCFKFQTEIDPVSAYNVLDWGAYVVRVVVSTRNARAATILLRLGIGKAMHREKGIEHENDEAYFSIALADNTVVQFLDDGDNVFDENIPALSTWKERWN